MLDGGDWYKMDGAQLSAIERLKAAAGVDLSSSFYSLLEYSDGGEGSLPVDPFNVVLDPADVTRKQIEEGTFHEYFAGLVVFGGNGGGEAIAFDTRNGAPYPVIVFDMANSDLAESVRPIAPDFDAFLELIGTQD